MENLDPEFMARVLDAQAKMGGLFNPGRRSVQPQVQVRPTQPWNINGSPSEFEPGFVEHLRATQYSLIDLKADGPLCKSRVIQWLCIGNNPDRPDRLAVIAAEWEDYITRQSRRMELARIRERNHPDNLPGFRELEGALNRFSLSQTVQIRYLRHSHRALYFSIIAEHVLAESDLEFSQDSLWDVFQAHRRYHPESKITFQLFKQKLRLNNWDSFFENRRVA